ncbi:MAG: hypothetical protein M9894_16330 [Planctomycetes bacterium]|nr:hypothetical protein [Planctomycetota bacterium]
MKSTGTIAKLLVSGCLGLGLGAVATGCNSSSDGQGKVLATGTGAITSDLSAVPPGMLPPGFVGDPSMLEGPRVEIVSPARAGHTTARRVAVEGVVTDLGGGVSDVRVQGRSVTPAADGSFREEVELAVGMNTIVVEAWDRAGHRRERFVNLIAGDLAPEGEPLADAATVRVTNGALDLIEPQIVAGIEAQRAQIRQQVLATRVGNDTTIKDFRFGRVTAGLDTIQGGVRFTATIADLAMDIEHKARVLLVFSSTQRGTVRAQRLEIEGLAQVNVVNGRATTNVVQVTARSVGFSVPDWARSEEATIRRSFENGFAAAAAQGLGQGLGDAFKSTSGTIAQAAGQGVPTELDWTLTTLTCDPAGATALFAANVRPPAAVAGTEGRSVVVRGGLANLTGGGGNGPNVAMAVHQDIVNRALHAAWRGGAMNLVIDQAAFDAMNPGSPMRLDTSALFALAPELAAVVAPGLPIEMRVEGLLPAVMTLRAGPLPHRLDLGGLKVTTFVLDPVNGRTPMGEACYAIGAEVAIVERQGQLALQPAGQVQVHVDALGPAQPGAELVLEKMAAALGPQLLQMALASQQGLVLPAVQGFTLGGLRLQALDGNLVVLGTAQASAP